MGKNDLLVEVPLTDALLQIQKRKLHGRKANTASGN